MNLAIMNKRMVIPEKCKYFYLIMIILIVVFISMPIMYIIANGMIQFKHDTDAKNTTKNILLFLWVLIDWTINGVLLYLYVKSVHIFSHEFYFKYDKLKQMRNSKPLQY